MNEERKTRFVAAMEKLSSVVTEIGEIGAEELDAYNSLPDGPEVSEHGEEIYARATALEDVLFLLCKARSIAREVG